MKTQCVICKAPVDLPSADFIPTEPGRVGNYVFSSFADQIRLRFSLCDKHRDSHGHNFPETTKIRGYAFESFTWIPCSSSALDSYAYQPATETLAVVTTGRKAAYLYFKVSPELFKELESATSIGRFWLRCIKFLPDGSRRGSKKIEVPASAPEVAVAV